MRTVVHVQCIQLFFPQTLLDLKNKSVSHSISRKLSRKTPPAGAISAIKYRNEPAGSLQGCMSCSTIGCTYAMTERKASSLHEKRKKAL